ncbi:MAG: amine oxidase, partial [Burkholderiaceae bacterium]
TRFISPTKTLEYMAAEKPIVSTSIRDVVDLYSDSVAIADSADQFLGACQAALTENATERDLRITRMRSHVEQCTWDLTARKIHAAIEAELRRKDSSVPVARAERAFLPAARPADALRGRTPDRTVAEIAVPTSAG